MPSAVCVYSSSSHSIDPAYAEAARALGAGLAERGDTLVYGGAAVGLMGEVARAVHAGGGRVIGVIPQSLVDREVAYQEADELIVTRDLRERKGEMERRSDSFVALPGGFGTLEEVLEVLTLRLLELHEKPIIFANINQFYDPLLALFERLYEARFARPESRSSYAVAADVPEVFRLLDDYQPIDLPSKWL
jgi:uncharacterized protein (TIGR00730 family)